MRAVIRWIRRQIDKVHTGPFRELENRGNWRVRYEDGRHSRFMDYASASNLAAIHQGRLLHRSD